MKFNVNVEVTDAEIKEYAYELLLKAGGAVAGSFASAFDDPQAVQFVVGMVQQAIQVGMAGAAAAHQRQRRGPYPTAVAVPGGLGPVPPGYAPPYPYPTGAVPPASHAYYPPGPPYGPMGPGPYHVPPAAGGPPVPNNVRPIQGEPAQVEHCFHIEANQQQEEGVVCCHCAAVNGVYRKACRRCAHQFCGAIVTPAPQGPPPPQVSPPPPPGYGDPEQPPFSPQGPQSTP